MFEEFFRAMGRGIVAVLTLPTTKESAIMVAIVIVVVGFWVMIRPFSRRPP